MSEKQFDVEGPFWVVNGKRVVKFSIRAVSLAVRARDEVEARKKADGIAVEQKWLGFTVVSVRPY